VTDDLNSANFAADGVLGIGWQTDNFYGTPSFVVALRNQGKITSSVFAFKLVQDDGELTIGGLNTDLYSGTPFYVPLQTPGYWEVLYAGFVGGSTTTDGGVAYFRSVRLESTQLFFILINMNRAILSPTVLKTR
jgi:Eukaryotic aspartyl protease